MPKSHIHLYAFGSLAERHVSNSLLGPGEEYLRSTHAQLLRASLLQYDLVQRGAPAAPQGQRQPRGGHGGERHGSRFAESRFNEERLFM